MGDRNIFNWSITYFALACVRMWDFKLVDCANFLLHPSKGQTYGRSPVCILTCVLQYQRYGKCVNTIFKGVDFNRIVYLKLKSREKRLPHPSKVHWNGFSPVWTNWCRLSLELSTNALPHSAQTCTRGPCVCKCLRIAELSRNILAQSLCGHPEMNEWMNGLWETLHLW